VPGPPKDNTDPRARAQSGRGRPTGRKGDTRDYLLDTARAVMVERGLGRATMREIADRAGVNPALLHYYFGTKTGLFTAIIERVRERLRGQLDQALQTEGSVSERLRAVIATYTAVIAAEPYIARLIIEELLERPHSDAGFTHGIEDLLSAHIRRLFEEGVSKGEFRTPNVPFDFAELMPQVVFFLLMAPLSRGGAQGVEQLGPWAAEAAEILLFGIHRASLPRA